MELEQQVTCSILLLKLFLPNQEAEEFLAHDNVAQIKEVKNRTNLVSAIQI